MMELLVEPLTSDAFVPFGTVIEQPLLGATAAGPGWRWWSETALLSSDGRAVALGYLALEPAALGFDWAEQHGASQEAIIPLDGDCLVYVAPSGAEAAESSAPLGDLRVFRVGVGQGVLLHPGVWHGAPLALDRPVRAIVLLLQHTGSQDTVMLRFPDRPVTIVVPAPDDRSRGGRGPQAATL